MRVRFCCTCINLRCNCINLWQVVSILAHTSAPVREDAFSRRIHGLTLTSNDCAQCSTWNIRCHGDVFVAQSSSAQLQQDLPPVNH